MFMQSWFWQRAGFSCTHISTLRNRKAGKKAGNIPAFKIRNVFQTAHPQNAGGAFRTLFVGANYKQGKQSGRHDSNMRPLGPKPSALPG